MAHPHKVELSFLGFHINLDYPRRLYSGAFVINLVSDVILLFKSPGLGIFAGLFVLCVIVMTTTVFLDQLIIERQKRR